MDAKNTEGLTDPIPKQTYKILIDQSTSALAEHKLVSSELISELSEEVLNKLDSAITGKWEELSERSREKLERALDIIKCIIKKDTNIVSYLGEKVPKNHVSTKEDDTFEFLKDCLKQSLVRAQEKQYEISRG